MPERTARALDQQRRSSGISIVGELQPSFQLVDKCNTMIETGALVWLAPLVCSKRDSEVSIGLHDKSPVVQLEKDSLKLAAPSQRIPVDVSTPLTLQWAWQRRGIALDQCGLITWHVHEAYVQRLLNFLTAPVPSGWTPVRTEQLIRADKEVWTLLAREVQPPYKTLPDGSKPLDVPFKNMFFDQRIQVWLAPVMSGAPAPSSSSTADKRVKVHDTEQGLLLFAFNGTLWRYVVCHFGAKFSAYWWQRVGGLITRILHASLAQYPHRAWLYVDDLLAALLRTSAHDSLLIIVLLLSCLGAPISWKKASVGDSLIWCGWKFNFAYETVELCAAKRLKLSSQIQGLLSKPKVPRKDLEACIGLLMWATNISLVLRPYIAPLYRLLHSPPGANYSIAPRMWPLFLHCLDSRAVFVREAMGLSIPLNSRVIEWGNRSVHCKADLPLMAKPTGHTWIRISDPTCPIIKMTRAAQSSLAWLAPRIAAIPTTPLSLPPLLSSLARADAMAEGDQVGIGGWVSTKHGLAWFAETYTMEEIRTIWPFLTKNAQKYIACFETIAQLALAMTAKAHLGHTRLSLCLPSESDNTPTEGGVNKLFTTSWPLSEFLSLIASWSSANGVTLQVSHVAGAHNEWADDLSRGRLQAFAHRTRDRLRISLDLLASASARASWSSKDPAQVSPIPDSPHP